MLLSLEKLKLNVHEFHEFENSLREKNWFYFATRFRERASR